MLLKSSWWMLSILIFLSKFQVVKNDNNLKIRTSMQQTDQIFTTNIPFIQSCIYDSQFISPGTISITPATPLNIFYFFSNRSKIAFWSQIKNGFDIMMRQNQLLNGYNGIIYKSSAALYQDIQYSINNTNDIISLFKISNNGTIIIYQVQVNVQNNNNFTLQTTIVKQVIIQTSDLIRKQIIECLLNQQTIQISQLTQQQLVAVCINSSLLYFISLNDTNQEQDLIINLREYNISLEISNFIVNPIVTIFHSNLQVNWNIFLVDQSIFPVQTYACTFNLSNFNDFQCLNSTLINDDFLIIIQSLWSNQIQAQQVKLDSLFNHFSPQVLYQFPGQINQVYIDIYDNVYIQSLYNDMTYLNIFDWNKQQILNLSFIGDVLLYNDNGLQFLIYYQTNNTFAVIIYDPPLLKFTYEDLNQSKFNIQIPCQDGIQNLNIQIQMIISNIQYPNALSFQLLDIQFNSYTNIFTFNVDEYFEVFGPGFTVYYKGPDQIQSTLIDSSIITTNLYVFSIIQMIVDQTTGNSIFRSNSITYTTQNSVYTYKASTQSHIKTISNPCGIQKQLKGIKYNQKSFIFYGYKDQFKQQIVYCSCNIFNNKISTDCIQLQKKAVIKKINKYPKLSKKIDIMQKLNLTLNFKNYDQTECLDCIKYRLYNLIDYFMLVTIYNNNSVILTNVWTEEIYNQINITCNNPTSLFGAIYTKKFYDPVLYLLCYNSNTIIQYLIKGMKFKFQRIIPIYGFQTKNTSTTIKVGASYLFIEVNLNLNSNISININPQNKQCCVLRIDPHQNTVSCISQIIFASTIIHVYKYNGIDVAYFNISKTSDNSFLKIYIGQTWLSLQQITAIQPVVSYNFTMIFASINYNIASQFPMSIIFNISDAMFTVQQIPIQKNIFLIQFSSLYYPEIYKQTLFFNYNGIFGPILNFYIQDTDNQQLIQNIELNQIITQQKIIGQVGDVYLQIFTPMDGKSQTTLDQTIIIVANQYIEVYLKYYNDIQTYYVGKVYLDNTIYQNCKYFAFQKINSTTIIFISQCQIPQFSLKTPTIILTLFIQTDKVELYYQIQQMAIVKHLTNMKTVSLGNISIVIGLQKAPMQSTSGKLLYCIIDENCSALYISSKQNFLLDYDAYIYGQNQFIIASLDFSQIQIWVNPIMYIQDQIYPNYIVNINNFISQYCSKITIIKANSFFLKAILSGSKFYYEINYTFGSSFQILSTYERYVNCQDFDLFSVQVILDGLGNLEAMITECKQNRNTLRLQMYETINSSSVVIYTGYLQYYTKYGPFSKSSYIPVPSYNPLKIIELSTSMASKLFMIYSSNNEKKLIYEKIDGVLIDNLLSIQPSLKIMLIPLTTDSQFPTLNMIIFNDYYSLDFIIGTSKAPDNYLTVYQLVGLIIFILFNFLNVIMFGLYCLCVKRKFQFKRLQRQSITIKSQKQQQNRFISLNEFKNKFRQRIGTIQSYLKSQKNQTRKYTQIQLFMRRQSQKFDLQKGKL